MTSGIVLGLDIETAMIEATRRKVTLLGSDNVRLALRDFVADGTGLASASIDYAMLFNILPAPEPVALLAEAFRVLRAGAKVGVVHWNPTGTPRRPDPSIARGRDNALRGSERPDSTFSLHLLCRPITLDWSARNVGEPPRVAMLSNVVDWLLLPSNLIAGLGALGIIALALRRLRLGLGLIVASVILLAVGGWSPLGPWLLAVLEERFPRPAIAAEPAGIIMLGGAVDTHISLTQGAVTLNDGAERVIEIAALSRLYPEARILLSGGAGPHQPGAATETALARDQLVALGVPAGRIELEERSLTTCENATESAELVAPAPEESWLLVTSAHHMPRAVACFRAAGFEVIAYPVDYRTDGRGTSSSIASGLESLDAAAHEWIGLITYRLSGATDELFPAPTPNEAGVANGG